MTTLISGRTRLAIYVILGAASTIVGAIQVGYAAIDAPNPDWLTVAIAVVPFLAGALGVTAATHTPGGGVVFGPMTVDQELIPENGDQPDGDAVDLPDPDADLEDDEDDLEDMVAVVNEPAE